MARPKEFDEMDVLDKALETFWNRGYQGTGIQAIVDATKVNRASLYSTYGSKQELFTAVLERYTVQCLTHIHAALAEGNSPVDGIRRMLQFIVEDTLRLRRGCLLSITAVEMSCHDPIIQEAVASGIGQIEQAVLAKVQQIQSTDGRHTDSDVLVLTRVVMAAMQSMAVRGSSGADRIVLESIRDGALLALQPRVMN